MTNDPAITSKVNMLHPAMLWEPLENDRVHCLLCPWDCKINPGKRGVCMVRVNEGGKLFSLIYGKVSSIAIDPIEKKPVFHYRPGSKIFSLGTFGCNMQCLHCQNWQISHTAPEIEDARLRVLTPEAAVNMAIENGCEGICWTYNEPTIWFEYAYDTSRLAKEKGLYTAFITNGYITTEALDMIGPYLDIYRVDIKGWNNELYKKLANIRDLQPVLDAAKRAKKKWNMHVECVTNIIPGMNDGYTDLKGIAEWIAEELGPETPWHVTRFYPNYKLMDKPPTPVDTIEKAREIGMKAGLKYVYIGNIPGHPGENTYCPTCGEMVIERMGYDIKMIGLEGKKHLECGTEIDLISKNINKFSPEPDTGK